MNAAGSAVGEVAGAVGSKVEQLVEMVDENILDYCTLDNKVCAACVHVISKFFMPWRLCWTATC